VSCGCDGCSNDRRADLESILRVGGPIYPDLVQKPMVLLRIAGSPGSGLTQEGISFPLVNPHCCEDRVRGFTCTDTLGGTAVFGVAAPNHRRPSRV
jgi:hypothetical protein